MKKTLLLALTLCVPLAACDGDDPVDAGTRDAGGSTDSGPALDSGPPDAGPPPPDAGPTDAGPTDAGPVDAGETDAGETDGGSADAGASDAGSDAGPVDAGPPGDAGLGALGDSCDDAPDLTTGGTFSGSTFLATNDYDPSISCVGGGPASGRDVAFSLSPATATTYQVTVTPEDSVYDPMLYYQLGSPCDFSGVCEGGSVLNGPGVLERLDVTVPGGQTAFIVIDGELVTRGAFTLEVSVE